MSKNNYNDFADFYDILNQDANYPERAEFFRTLLVSHGIGPGACVADLGCGTGEITCALAQAGYDMIGVDCSEAMLEKAQEKAREKKLDILFLNQPMEELDLFGTYRAAVSTLDTLNHLESKEALAAAIKKTALFMEPGGLFVFDVNTVYKHRNILANNTFIIERDDVFCSWQNELNSDNSVDIFLDFFRLNPDGSYTRFYEDFTERAYEISELIEILEKSDFEVEKIYDDISFNDLTPLSQRATFAAKYTGKK